MIPLSPSLSLCNQCRVLSSSFPISLFLSQSLCMYICAINLYSVYMCCYVYIHYTHTHCSPSLSISISMCVCVYIYTFAICVCLCARVFVSRSHCRSSEWHASFLPLPYYVRRFLTDHNNFVRVLSRDLDLDLDLYLDLALFVAPPPPTHPPSHTYVYVYTYLYT